MAEGKGNEVLVARPYWEASSVAGTASTKKPGMANIRRKDDNMSALLTMVNLAVVTTVKSITCHVSPLMFHSDYEHDSQPLLVSSHHNKTNASTIFTVDDDEDDVDDVPLHSSRSTHRGHEYDAQPLLVSSNHNNTNANASTIFTVDDDEDDVDVVPLHSSRSTHSVRFTEDVQVIGPPLRSTLVSREAGVCVPVTFPLSYGSKQYPFRV